MHGKAVGTSEGRCRRAKRRGRKGQGVASRESDAKK